VKKEREKENPIQGEGKEWKQHPARELKGLGRERLGEAMRQKNRDRFTMEKGGEGKLLTRVVQPRKRPAMKIGAPASRRNPKQSGSGEKKDSGRKGRKREVHQGVL